MDSDGSLGEDRPTHVRFADEYVTTMRQRRPRWRRDSNEPPQRPATAGTVAPRASDTLLFSGSRRQSTRDSVEERPRPSRRSPARETVTRAFRRTRRGPSPEARDALDVEVERYRTADYTHSPEPLERPAEAVSEPGDRLPPAYQDLDRQRVSARAAEEPDDDEYYYHEPRRRPTRETEASSRFLAPEYRTRRYFRPRSLFIDEGDAYDKFTFSLPEKFVAESSREDASETESPAPEDRASLVEDVGQRKSAAKQTIVNSSHYTGTAELGGSHSATLTEVLDPRGRKQALFRWLHIPQEVMSFDELWVEISRLHGLSEPEKKALTLLRANVKRNCVGTVHNPQGTKVGYLQPSVEEWRDQSSDSKRAPTAKWVCIPYFSLQPYSGLLAASSVSLFPNETLLQAQNSRNTMKRDMEQAVCQLNSTKRGECFHVSQLWSITVGNSLLVTCGNMSLADLRGEDLTISSAPLHDPGAGKIIVSYKDSVFWTFTINECPTYFSFITKFWAFWPKCIVFKHKGHVVTGEKWPKLIKLATSIRRNIHIVLKTTTEPDPPVSGIIPGAPPGELSVESEQAVQLTKDFVPVLTLALEPSEKPMTTAARMDMLNGQLEAAEKFLMMQGYMSRKYYKSCDKSTRQKCFEYLTVLATTVENIGTDEVRRAYEKKIDIFNAADVIYGFFLPTNFEGPTSSKYWGSVRTLLEPSTLEPGHEPSSLDDIAGEMRTDMRSFTRDIFAIQNIVSQVSDGERAAIILPQQFVTAWLYVVMAMVFGAHDSSWRLRFNRGRQLVSQGLEALKRGFSEDLNDKLAVLPLETLSLVTLNILKDQVGKADDISETYYQYLESLECDIASKPSDRAYQQRIDLVQQELTTILDTLYTQETVVSDIRSSLATGDAETIGGGGDATLAMVRDRERDGFYDGFPGPDTFASRTLREVGAPLYDDSDDSSFLDDIKGASKLSPTDPSGLRGLLFQECTRFITQREEEVQRQMDKAGDLERALTLKMSTTKDRQEKAIFAFTLVTIIFMPLSTVSSIFGMNTSDVRNLSSSQWLYWAVALPVTLLVIVGGLWFMGELGDTVRWLLNWPRGPASWYGPSGPDKMPQTQALDQSYYQGQTPPPPPPAAAPRYERARWDSAQSRYGYRPARSPRSDGAYAARRRQQRPMRSRSVM